MISRNFSGAELSRYEAHEVVALLRKREASPRELLDIAFSRIRETSPAINATVTTCEERAYAAAGELKTEAPDHPGCLFGLPIGIKDLNNVAGVRTSFGNRHLADFVATKSEPMVERLEARGALIAGKTNSPEFGAGGNTFNDVFGPTLNPWDTRLNAGGSSGGAAASLIAGETWLSQGSDHGGSLRTPAAYCGIVGLRPSPGRVGGGTPGASFMTEGVQGPMARSVRDCALFMDALSGSEPRDPISYPAPEGSFQEAVLRADGKVRVAYSPDLNGFSPVDREMRTHLDEVMVILERSGATVEATDPDLPNLERTYHTLRGVGFATMARRIDPAVRATFKATLEANVKLGEALTVGDIVDANLDRAILYDKMLELFKHFDVLACPTVGCMPHPQTEEYVSRIDGQELGFYMDWLRFAFLATTTSLPAISVPVGLGPRNLPVGLQLIGKPRGEAALLSAARAVEMAVGGPFGPIDPIISDA